MRLSLPRIGKVKALWISAAAASATRPSLPAKISRVTRGPTPGLDDSTDQSRPGSQSHRPALASKATTSSAPSDAEYRSSTSRASPSRNQISPMRPSRAVVIMISVFRSVASKSSDSLKSTKRGDEHIVRNGERPCSGMLLASSHDLAIAAGQTASGDVTESPACAAREEDGPTLCVTFRRDGKGPRSHVAGGRTTGLYASALTPRNCDITAQFGSSSGHPHRQIT